MSHAIKIIKRRESLSNIIPPMIIEIIQEHIIKYVQDNRITKYNVEFGYIEESVSVDIDDDILELTERSVIMTFPAKVIEAFLFDHFTITKDVYIKVRNREILRHRQIVQFYMCHYADMSLAAIGMVTGGSDHATVMHSKKTVRKRLLDNTGFKKEMFLIDRTLTNKLGIKSKVFDMSTNVI
jgi:chromosomal replication initiation ATPase DnaA